MNPVSSYTSLREEDGSWDYRGEFTKRLTHGFHSYPAMMIPQVASRLIENYSGPGDTVLDPFCGSGSVLVEAIAGDRNAWGVDLNRVALLVARVKTRPIDPLELRQLYSQLFGRIRELGCEQIVAPAFFNVDYWFKPDVARQLARIRLAIDRVSPDETAVQEFFLVAFSETVRLCSNSRSHEFKLFRYPPHKLANHHPDPIAIFRQKLERNIERMGEFFDLCKRGEDDCWCRPILADSSKRIPEIQKGSVDVVVTSPPYGDSRTTVAYGQFSRLSAQWLGFDDEKARSLDTELMGGRTVPFLAPRPQSASLDRVIDQIAESDPVRARQALSFYVDLYNALRNIAETVRPGGHLCIVIGNRRVKKVQLPTDVIIAEMASTIGLRPERIIVRNIPSKTMPLKNSPTNVAGELELTMHKEYIVVLRKQSLGRRAVEPSPEKSETAIR